MRGGTTRSGFTAIASVEECENLCLTDPSCAGYTYNVNKTTCIPKTAIGLLTPTREPAITGVVNQRSGSSIAQSGMPPVTMPSFDCLKARAPGERAICASQTLSRLDGELANRYRAWLDSHSGAAASVSQRHQKEFLAAEKMPRKHLLFGRDLSTAHRRFSRATAVMAAGPRAVRGLSKRPASHTKSRHHHCRQTEF